MTDFSGTNILDAEHDGVYEEPAPEMMEPYVRPTVLIVHASVGSGHLSAANAIKQAFDLAFDEGDPTLPPDLNVEVLDILDFGRTKVDGDKTASLFTGITRWYYDITWRYTFTGRILWGGGTIWSHVMFPRFTEYVRKKKPIAIIATHITGANCAAAARMLTGQEFPLVCVPTDYEVEGFWPHSATDLFCVANEHMAETLRPRKISEDRIRITGIPTRVDFRTDVDAAAVREKLGLPADKHVAVALAGAHLPRPYIHFRAALDKMLPELPSLRNLHMVIVAGRDEEYKQRLEAEVERLGITNVTILGYVNEMASLMKAADYVICKSGGLTVTECLCAEAPMILLGRSYGQEKSNVHMLTAMGAAMHVTTARELVEALRNIEYNPYAIQSMLLNGSFIRKPNAAVDIMHTTMELTKHPRLATDPVRKKHFIHLYLGGRPAHVR